MSASDNIPASESITLEGKCLCGGISITIANAEKIPGQALCHCSDCQHTSGTACTWNVMVEFSDLKVEGSSLNTYQSAGKSGKTVTRAFCRDCGSPAYHHSPIFGEKNAVQTGHFPYFADKPIVLELWGEKRWPVLPEVPGATVLPLQ